MMPLRSDHLKRLLVIGAEGFLGRHIVKHFKSKGFDVFGIDRITPESVIMDDIKGYYQLSLPNGNLGFLLKQLNPSVCVHCAGNAIVTSSIEDPISDYYSGPVLTFEILEQFRRYLPKCCFVFLSSAAVYGNPKTLPITEEHPVAPISPYGFHKLQSEIICAEYSKVYGISTASLRIFSAYGIGLRRQVMWDICHKALTQKPLTLLGTGNETRDFINATDIAKAIEKIIYFGPMLGDVYNVASGMEITIRDLAEILLDYLNVDNQVQFDGISPQGIPLKWHSDISKIKALGFQVETSLKTGLEAYVNWFKSENGLPEWK